jgi:hypothetical protein
MEISEKEVQKHQPSYQNSPKRNDKCSGNEPYQIISINALADERS